MPVWSLPRARTRPSGPFAAAVACALLGTLAGCGSDSTPAESSSGHTHTMHTVMGNVQVPDHPRRVVVLDTNELDDALTLGVTPVGASTADQASGFPSYLSKRKLAHTRKVGTIGSPNLEEIAKLDPDLILSSKVRDEKNYRKLSDIAPTVFTRTTGATWKKNFAVHAEALGRTSRRHTAVQRYRTHVHKLTRALGGATKAKRVKISMVRFVEGAPTRLYGKGSYIGSILDDVGLGRPRVQNTAKMMVEISPEQVQKADGDVLFHSTYGASDDDRREKVLHGPLWPRLDAVLKHRAYRVDDELWMQGIGYTAAESILTQLRHDLKRAGKLS